MITQRYIFCSCLANFCATRSAKLKKSNKTLAHIEKIRYVWPEFRNRLR